MLRVAICEDEPIHTAAILRLMEEYQAVSPALGIYTGTFDSGDKLLSALEQNGNFNVFLLDIMMPGLSGIELARELRQRGEDAPVIFLTSTADYALDAFGVQAIQYILKPIKKDALFPILDKVAAALKKETEPFWLVSTPERIVKVPFSSIVCVESSCRTMRVYLADGRKLASKTIRVPFATAASALLADSRFLYAHKSFVLNMEMVVELTGTSFVMKGGTEVPVPKYKYTDAKARYFDYLSTRGKS